METNRLDHWSPHRHRSLHRRRLRQGGRPAGRLRPAGGRKQSDRASPFRRHTRLRPFAHLAAAAAHERIIDMGPGAGAEGGKVMFEGAPRELLRAS